MHERVSVNALCFPGDDLPRMAEHWRALKPARIAFMSQLLPDDLSVPREIIADGGYRLESMTHIFQLAGQYSPDEEVWAEQRAKLGRAIGAVSELGGKSIYLMTGGHGDLIWEDAADCFARAIAPCLAQAKAAGLELMIETASPLYADAHLVHSLRDTVELAEIAGLGVCIDLFACWTEAGLKQTIERTAPRTHLVQVGDYAYGDRGLPCRAVPGDGNIPLERLFDWILSAGYTGAFDLELIGPRIDAEGRLEATRRAADKVSELLVKLGA
jgi:sugar phosphate isomerase/epimerase